MSNVIALLCSDIHLSEKAPVARSAETDWFAAQARPLRQLRNLQEKYDCPVICAGDIFDRWRSSPELINWAIKHLPKMYAVSGQHDQPYHNLDDLHKSAYQTLVEAGVIVNIDQEDRPDRGPYGDMVLHGYPWGKNVIDFSEEAAEDKFVYGPSVKLHVAVIHSYIYDSVKTSYPGAPKESHLIGRKKELGGYDIAVFGDNHAPFLAKSGDCEVANCGCLIRRKQDERGIKPAVGLLYQDESITQHFLDTSEDKWIDEVVEPQLEEMDPKLTEFLSELEGLSVESLDFRDAILRYVNDNKVGGGTKKILLEVLEG